jgi:hypothetical protein
MKRSPAASVRQGGPRLPWKSDGGSQHREGRKLDRFLTKLNRYASYLLIPVVLLMLMTGYRSTGAFPFIPRGFADLFHRIYLNAVFLFLFFLHTLLSLRIVLKRKQRGSRLLDVVLILIGTGMFGFFTYLSLKLILPL